MGEEGYKIRNQQAIHFITFAVVEWVDVFTRREYKDIVVESLCYCQKEKGLVIHGWVLMTNHVHFILSAKEGFELSNILRDFKKYTSLQLIGAISESKRSWMLSIFRQAGKQNSRNMSYQFWQQDNHPKELSENNIQDQKLDYIHNNPVIEGIVENAEDYLYSSARDYCGKQGLLKVDLLE